MSRGSWNPGGHRAMPGDASHSREMSNTLASPFLSRPNLSLGCCPRWLSLGDESPVRQNRAGKGQAADPRAAGCKAWMAAMSPTTPGAQARGAGSRPAVDTAVTWEGRSTRYLPRRPLLWRRLLGPL